MQKQIKKSAISARVRHHGRAETRATILKAADCIYAEHGLAGARTEAIAAAAGVNKALLSYNFKSNAEVLKFIRYALFRNPEAREP